MSEHVAELVAIIEEHQRQHDANHQLGLCMCTLCVRGATALNRVRKLCVDCGNHADGTVEGKRLCVVCMAEHKATVDSNV